MLLKNAFMINSWSIANDYGNRLKVIYGLALTHAQQMGLRDRNYTSRWYRWLKLKLTSNSNNYRTSNVMKQQFISENRVQDENKRQPSHASGSRRSNVITTSASIDGATYEFNTRSDGWSADDYHTDNICPPHLQVRCSPLSLYREKPIPR